MIVLSNVFTARFSTVAEIAPICDLLTQDPNRLFESESQHGFTVFNKLTQLLASTSDFQAYLITFLLDILPRIDTHRAQLLLTPDLNNNSPLHRLSYSSHYEVLKKLIDVLKLDRDDLLRAFFKTNIYDETAFKNLVDPYTENKSEVLAVFLKDYFGISREQGREIVVGNQLNQLKQLIESDDFHKTPFFKSTEFSIISGEGKTYRICDIKEKECVWYFEYFSASQSDAENTRGQIAFLTESTPSQFSKFRTAWFPYSHYESLKSIFESNDNDFINAILEDYKINPRRYFKRMIHSLREIQMPLCGNNPFFPAASHLTVDKSEGSQSADTLRVNFKFELLAVLYFRWLKTISGFQKIGLQRDTKTPLLYIVFTRADIQRLVEFVFPSAPESKRNTWVDTIFTCAEKSMPLFELFPQLPICDEKNTQLHFQNLKHTLFFRFFDQKLVDFMETGLHYMYKGWESEEGDRTFRTAVRAAFIVVFDGIINSAFANNTDVVNCFRLLSPYFVAFLGPQHGSSKLHIHQIQLFVLKDGESGLINIMDVVRILVSLNIISFKVGVNSIKKNGWPIYLLDRAAENHEPYFQCKVGTGHAPYTLIDGKEGLPELPEKNGLPRSDLDCVVLNLLNTVFLELREKNTRENTQAFEQAERTALESKLADSVKIAQGKKCFKLADCEIVSINYSQWCTVGAFNAIISYTVPPVVEARTLTLYQDGSVQNRKFRDSFEEGLVKLLNALKIKFALTQKHLPFLDQYNFFFEQFEKIYDDYLQNLHTLEERGGNPMGFLPARNKIEVQPNINDKFTVTPR